MKNTLAVTRIQLENKSARKGLSRRQKVKWNKHYASVLRRTAQSIGFPTWEAYAKA